MKKAWLILLGGLLAGIAGYACVFLAGTAGQRAVNRSGEAELAWLRGEYHLSDAEFGRVRKLHEEYRPTCAEMCRKIAEKNNQLKALMAGTNAMTPEIRQAFADAALLRARCEANMLAHFYAVAKTMPTNEGRRYLAWVEQETLAPRGMMMPEAASPEPHVHP